jgi:hypothetical protein
MREIMRWQLPPPKSPFETLLRRSSDAIFCASGAHVLNVRCAPVLENHAIRLAAATFQTGSGPPVEHFITKYVQALIA